MSSAVPESAVRSGVEQSLPSKSLKLKPISSQVIVITGATSGIGLSTARAAAARGATLVLAARNELALKAVCDDLTHKGAKVVCKVTDVGDEAQMRALADEAIARFGGFDTWVNNAGVSIFGAITQTPLEDQRRLFDTNYWGVVHGSLIAVEHFKTRPGGGSLINMGSVLSDMAVPQQGAYSASKHAVKGFTNALRMELIAQRAPVSVTLIKPSAIDTPYKDHARNLTGTAVKNPPPVYATPLVAQAILYAAQHKVREVTVGAGGSLLAGLGVLAPLLAEPFIAWTVPALSRDRKSHRRTLTDNLHHAGQDLRERSFYGHVREHSLYATAQMRPKATFSLALAFGVLAGAALTLSGSQRRARAAGAIGRQPPVPLTIRQALAARLGLNGLGARAAP
jgi:short-subunit dehydrogenase